MTSKINYEEGPIGEVQIFADFLPSPEELAFREETVKVTIALSKKSVDLFLGTSQKEPCFLSKNDTPFAR